MIDLKDLRENPDKYRRGAELKGVKVDIDRLLQLDAQLRSADQKRQNLTAEKNRIGKEIGAANGRLKKDEALLATLREAGEDPTSDRYSVSQSNLINSRQHLGSLQEKASALKQDEQRLEPEIAAIRPELESLLLRVPQPPDDEVPKGRDAADNVVAWKWGEPRQFDFKPKSHLELGESLGILDFKAGVRLAGSRSYFLKGAGADLHHAILRYAIDVMTREKGFTNLVVPVMVREAGMKGTGFFPAGREQAYRVGEVEETGEDIRFLTGTAEVALTAYVMPEKDEVTLTEADLPLKLTAVSTCFRREAGTYGKDTAGLYRVHQFDKCEQVVICRNDVEESKKWHREMLGYSEELLKRLNLPYRVIQCCTGDIGVKNAAMYDVETWMPSRAQPNHLESGYGETHSASRLYEFQARRLNLRYKDKDGKTRFAHTLNNTVVASPRILIPILENHQNADGTVTIPEVLRPYMGGREKIG